MLRLLRPERKPEPELMDAAEDGSVYAGAAAAKHLSELDDTFVQQALASVRQGPADEWLLDVGCGPGAIALKIARARPDVHIVGVDGSAVMLSAAKRSAGEQGLLSRVHLVRADAKRLCFRDGLFAGVLCNSVLHHLSEPRPALREMERVLKRGGALLLRDLRRPSRLGLPLHLRWHGRHYSGRMKLLFEDSVRAAYTTAEIESLLKGSRMHGTRVFTHGRAHLGFLYRSQTGA